MAIFHPNVFLSIGLTIIIIIIYKLVYNVCSLHKVIVFKKIVNPLRFIFCGLYFARARLEGKVAIITGGESGIGEATTRLFVENGALVIIGDVQDDLGTQLAKELGDHVAVYRHCDVTIESDMEGLVTQALTKWGKLDIMYSNAGIIGNFTGGMQNLNIANFDKVMNVNIRGMVLAVKHASRVMIDTKTRGSIICTGSMSSVTCTITPIEYTISKHALLGLMKGAASDLGKFGIRVNCISPSVLITPLSLKWYRDIPGNNSIPEHEVQDFVNSTNVLSGHTFSALDVAQAALYLASDDAAFVSGHNLLVDGGITVTDRTYQQAK